MCESHICDYNAYRRAEKGERGVSRPVAARRRAPPRVRAPEADRIAIEGCAHLPRRHALSVAVPDGRARLDRRTMGGESGRATAAILSPHTGRPSGARDAAAELEGIRLGNQSS